MSHDQKPTRVRVVQNAATPERRRRSDRGSAAVAMIDGDAVKEPPALATGDARGTALLLLGAVFLVAAGAGGLLVALLAPS